MASVIQIAEQIAGCTELDKVGREFRKLGRVCVPSAPTVENAVVTVGKTTVVEIRGDQGFVKGRGRPTLESTVLAEAVARYPASDGEQAAAFGLGCKQQARRARMKARKLGLL